MLAAFLDSLAAIELALPSPEVFVVVVDNDDGESARPVIDTRLGRFRFPILTATEQVRNIALARNRSVEIALREGADWVVIADDDELVSPGWLSELLAMQQQTGADVVAGPVVNRYPDGTPAWLVESGLPLRPRYENGAMLQVADTANVLVSRRVFGLVPGHFDARFGLSGGSDSLFFARAHAAGARITWAAAAVVFETHPRSRVTIGWLLRRAFRNGNAAVHVARSMVPAHAWLPRRIASASYHFGRGVLLLPAAAVRGRAAGVAALQELSLGAGAAAAFAGYRYVEYKRVHGA